MVFHLRWFGLFLTLGLLSTELHAQLEERLPSETKTASNDEFAGKESGEGKALVPEINFRWCPAGSFTMGSPKSELGYNNKHYGDEDQVAVTLSSGFWLGETEVTQGQWQSLMNTTPWSRKNYVQNDAQWPAVYINYDDAIDYCARLTEQERAADRLPMEWKYMLSTEAQWEYACRAGTKTKFSFGESEGSLSDYVWWGGIVGDGSAKSEQYAHEVGLKKANAWGLRDMHGNVWEWCGDWYGDKLPGGTDPVGSSSGSLRVNRGGGWGNDASGCRSANRYGLTPGYRGSDLGFRVAGVPSSQ